MGRSSLSALTSLRARIGASVSFRPSAVTRSSRNLTLFCSSSWPPWADATVAPPPTQAAAEEAKPAAPGGEEKVEPTVEELAGRLDICARDGIFFLDASVGPAGTVGGYDRDG
jgi:hypothetical protein